MAAVIAIPAIELIASASPLPQYWAISTDIPETIPNRNSE